MKRRIEDLHPITRALWWLIDNPHVAAAAVLIFILACWGIRRAATGA